MLRFFKISAYLEGASFLILLLIAMPLKYFYSMPMAVRIVGSAHGALFVLYVILALQVWRLQKWSIQTAALAFIAAFLPFGPFIFDRKILSHDTSEVSE